MLGGFTNKYYGLCGSNGTYAREPIGGEVRKGRRKANDSESDSSTTILSEL